MVLFIFFFLSDSSHARLLGFDGKSQSEQDLCLDSDCIRQKLEAPAQMRIGADKMQCLSVCYDVQLFICGGVTQAAAITEEETGGKDWA